MNMRKVINIATLLALSSNNNGVFNGLSNENFTKEPELHFINLAPVEKNKRKYCPECVTPGSFLSVDKELKEDYIPVSFFKFNSAGEINKNYEELTKNNTIGKIKVLKCNCCLGCIKI